MQSSTSSANSRAAKGGSSKDEEAKRHEIVTIALLPAGSDMIYTPSSAVTHLTQLPAQHIIVMNCMLCLISHVIARLYKRVECM